MCAKYRASTVAGPPPVGVMTVRSRVVAKPPRVPPGPSVITAVAELPSSVPEKVHCAPGRERQEIGERVRGEKLSIL